MFQLFDFYCMLVQYSFFLLKIYFWFPFFDDFEWEVKFPWQLLYIVTLPEAAEAATHFSMMQNFTQA